MKRWLIVSALVVLALPASAMASGGALVLGPAESLNPAERDAGVSVDSIGTAHFVWTAPGEHSVSYCEIPAGASSCSVNSQLPVIDGADPSQSVFSVHVVQDSNDQPLIALGLCCRTPGEELLTRGADGVFHPELLGTSINPATNHPYQGQPVVDFGVDNGFGGGDVVLESTGTAIDVLGQPNGVATVAQRDFQIDPFESTGPASPPTPLTSGANQGIYPYRIGTLPAGETFVLGGEYNPAHAAMRVETAPGQFAPNWISLAASWPANLASGPSGGTYLLDATPEQFVQSDFENESTLLLHKFRGINVQSGTSLGVYGVSTCAGANSTVCGRSSPPSFPQPFEDTAGTVQVVWPTVGKAAGCPKNHTCLAYRYVRGGRLGPLTLLDTQYDNPPYEGVRDYVATNGDGDGWELTIENGGSSGVRAVARRLFVAPTLVVGGVFATLRGPGSPFTGTRVPVALVVRGRRGVVKRVTFTLTTPARPEPSVRQAAAAARKARPTVTRVVDRKPPFAARLSLPRRRGSGKLCDVRYAELLTVRVVFKRGARTLREPFTWCPRP
jgi:hypothetical protein